MGPSLRRASSWTFHSICDQPSFKEECLCEARNGSFTSQDRAKLKTILRILDLPLDFILEIKLAELLKSRIMSSSTLRIHTVLIAYYCSCGSTKRVVSKAADCKNCLLDPATVSRFSELMCLG